MGASAPQTGLGSAQAPEPHSGLRPSDAIPRAGSLLHRLRATEHRGRYAHGGGSIGPDGKGTSYGGGKIMEPRNPDGCQAADLIEALDAALEAFVDAWDNIDKPFQPEMPRLYKHAKAALAKARGEQ